MNRFHKAVSACIASSVMLTLFSPVMADPVGGNDEEWMNTGYQKAETVNYPYQFNTTPFEWQYKPGEIHVYFSPSESEYSEEPDMALFNECFMGTGSSDGTVYLEYSGSAERPMINFVPIDNNIISYSIECGPDLHGYMNIYNVSKVNNLSVKTTDELLVCFNDYEGETLPHIVENNASDLYIEVRGSSLPETVSVPYDYSEKDVVFRVFYSDSVKRIELPEGLDKIPDYAFSNDSVLEEVNIPNTVTSLEYGSFNFDKALKQLSIPKSVKSIKPDALNFSGITDIYYDSTIADWENIECYELDWLDEAKGYSYVTYEGLFTTQDITVHCLDGDIVIAKKLRSETKPLTPTPTPVEEPPTETPTTPPTGSPTTPPTTVPTNDPKGLSRDKMIKDFIERLYIYVLDREPDPTGTEYWEEKVARFEITGADVAWGFLLSKEFKDRNVSDSEFTDILYKVFFDREPDPDGKAYWISRLKNGATREEVAYGFIYSVEWANTCAGYGIYSGSDTKPDIKVEPTEELVSFVTRLYGCALDREPDEAGLDYWCDELANFRITGENAAISFFLSNEFVSKNISDTVFIERLYKTFMDREPDADGKAYWLGQLKNGDSREHVIRSFSRSNEFITLCERSGIKPY